MERLELEPMESEQPPRQELPRWVKPALYLLLLLAIAGGGVALLTPSARSLSEVNATVAAERETQRAREEAISRAQVIDANLPILKKEGEKLAAEFASVLEPEEADRLVTALVKAQGLTPRTLTPGEFQPARLPGTKTELAGGSLRSCRITATMSGGMSSFWNLVSAVSETPGLRIVEFSSREVTKPVSADALAADPFGAQSETETVHTVVFELVTYEPPVFELSGGDTPGNGEEPPAPETPPDEVPGTPVEPSAPEEPPAEAPGTSPTPPTGMEPPAGGGNLPSADSDTLETGDDPNGPLWNRD